MVQKKQNAPSHLRKETASWFSGVLEEYVLEEHHIKLLTLAAESWDRCVQSREALKKHGLTFTDRFGQPHARPEVAIERDNRIAFARLIRELALDVAPPPDSSRPEPIRGNSHRRLD